MSNPSIRALCAHPQNQMPGFLSQPSQRCEAAVRRETRIRLSVSVVSLALGLVGVLTHFA